MEQFGITVEDNGQGRFFNIKPLGNARYQIYIEDETIGTIQLDEKNHAHCESVGCELDIPLLNAIRDEIQLHEKWKSQL
ncbi:hypothetical protein [Pedobacter hiemivivus]|uniref:Uncharacterized protein n=1 Tax=Pedobacter hiemivivus TaxID=2530454 RepID=A0A4R0N0C5_9SPHI|nr:hypothetical protein [Pedobacter hiemivivus]TCC93148.1 hypothetical protein EZ444_17975 [Pedobacter hiemivivus]